MFALIDCNNFYASCERVFQPHLKNKPLVILSNNDGCVIARSNEAKSLGIPMGAPAFKYKEIFQKNNVQIFSWPTLPLELLNKENDSIKIWSKMLCFSTKEYNIS